jgi:hypothetical protein
MFLLCHFEDRSSDEAAGFGRLSLISVLQLYLTDFLKRIFSAEIALNRVFCWENAGTPPPFTTPQLTKARRHENRRSVDGIFTSCLSLSRRFGPVKTADVWHGEDLLIAWGVNRCPYPKPLARWKERRQRKARIAEHAVNRTARAEPAPFSSNQSSRACMTA